MEKGDVFQIFKKPGHPYTKLLIGAIPSMESVKGKKLISIPGKPPNL
ncbi:MAG: oligopeptide/dipeptide ABC transporter ATP-binding protein, partial [Promethearchaeota archaeon]